MANMLLARKVRGTVGINSCHDECETRFAPRQRAAFRRAVKRTEKRNWQKETRNFK